jgi:hypothetical protein
MLVQRGRGGIPAGRENPKAAADADTLTPSTRTRRTISYFTCTRSRASRNSDPANS